MTRKIPHLLFAIVLLGSCSSENKEAKVKENGSPVSANFNGSPIKGENYNITIDGATLPGKISLDNSPALILNGAGVRTKFRLKVYVAALYLKAKNSNAIEIMNADAPLAMRLHVTSILMTSENFTKYIVEGFKRSTNGNTKPIQKQIDLAVSIFNKEPVEKNDIFDLFYIPEEKGIKAYKNGKFLSFLSGGVEFKKAMLGIWLSEDPVDEDLKDGILGLKVD